MNQKSFLTGVLEAGVIAFTFGAERVSALEGGAGSVDGEAVIVRDSDIFGAAAVFPAVIPILVIAGAYAGLGLAEGAAELLAGTTVIGGLAVLVHGEAGLAKEIANRQFGRVFGISPVEGDNGLALIDVTDGVVDGLGVIALIGDEGAFPDGDDLIGSTEDIESDGGIGDIGGRGEFADGQAGDAIHEDMVLVAPVELVVLFVVLVGGGDRRGTAQADVRVFQPGRQSAL